MSFARNPLPNVTAPPSSIFSIRNFKGLNVLNGSSEIDDEESPDMLNITVNDFGVFENRNGYARIYPTSLGAGAVNGLYEYIKLDGTSIILMSWGNKLYKVTEGLQPVQIATPHGLNSNKARFFTMNNYCWIYDKQHYYRFDGITVVDVTSIATIPVISITRSPDGSTTQVNGHINMLQPGFTEWFSGTASDTVYHLSYDTLDATPVTIIANNVARTEGTHFTVNRTAGTINFAGGTSPLGSPGAGTDNVEITAYKTIPGSANTIINSLNHILYGGKNDTRVWFAGDNSNVVSFSDNYDPSYFPDDNYIAVGSDSDILMNFSLQYDTLIVHKKESKWQISYTTDTDGLSMYILRPINDNIGCIAVDSVQLLDNNPVALTETGVFSLTSSNVRDERNVQSISLKIDKLLLAEPNLQNAVSTDYQHKYYLVLNNNAYVYDYYLGAWFFWNDIKASCFLVSKDYLYFGSNAEGLVYKFQKTGINVYLDDGNEYDSYWASKVFDLGSDSRNKLVDRVFYSVRPDVNSYVALYYKTDQVASDIVSEESVTLFDYQRLSYADFTYKANVYPNIIMTKIKAKKILYFQLIFRCNQPNSQMAIMNIDIKFAYQGFKK